MTFSHQAEVNAEPPKENKISREETRNPDLSESASPRARAAAMGEDEDEDALPIGKVLIRRGGRPKKRKTENNHTHMEIESENNDSLSLGFGATNPNSNSRVLKRFGEGDMVWGKVKSHPWWPGQIYNPAFATASAKRSRRSGHVLVAFFGDATFGWFVESNLVPFEPTYRDKSKQTSSRSFCEAVEDAVDEIGRRASLGLMCGCRNRNSFKSTSRESYVQVSVPGWELPVVYPERVLKDAREDFRPEQMIEFVKRMAVAPLCGEDTAVSGIKAVAEAKAYRSAVAVPVNPEYRKALRLVSRSSGNEDGVEVFVQLEDPVQGTQKETSDGLSIKHQNGHAEAAEREGKSSYEGQVREKEEKYLFKRRDAVNKKQSNASGGSSINGIKRSTSNEQSVLVREEEEADDVSKYVFQKRSECKEGRDVREGKAVKECQTLNNKGGPKEEEEVHIEQHDRREAKRRKRETTDLPLHLAEEKIVEKPSLKQRAKEIDTSSDFSSNTSDRLGLKLRSNDSSRESFLAQSVRSEPPQNGAKGEVPKLLPKNLKKAIHAGVDSEQRAKRGRPKRESPDEVGHTSRKRDRANDETFLTDNAGSKVSGVISDKSLPVEASDEVAHRSRKRYKTKNETSLKDNAGSEVPGALSEKSLPQVLPKKKRPRIVDVDKDSTGRVLSMNDANGNTFFEKSVEGGGEGVTNDGLVNDKQRADLGNSKEDALDTKGSILSARPEEEHLAKLDGLEVDVSCGIASASAMVIENGVQQETKMTKNEVQNVHDNATLVGNQLQSLDSHLESRHLNYESNLSIEKKASFDSLLIPARVSITEGQGTGTSEDVSEGANDDLLKTGDVRGQVIISDEKDTSRVPEPHNVETCSPRAQQSIDNVCAGSETSGKGDSNHFLYSDRSEAKDDDKGCSALPSVQDSVNRSFWRNVDTIYSGSFPHQLVKDLRSLGVDPFYGIERGCPQEAKSLVLRFRTSVYEKIPDSSYFSEASMNSLPPVGIQTEEDKEEKAVERPLTTFSGHADANDGVASNNIVSLRSREAALDPTSNMQPVTKLSRNETQTLEASSKAKENKRRKVDAWSDDLSKRLKKVCSSPEKPSSKTSAKRQSGSSGRDSREPVRQRKRVSQSSDSQKALEEPMALCMKFPQGFALPSEAQLKARFVRFGQLDISGTRIYCQTNCARVVFKCTSDAEAAYKYATENSLFGQSNVKFKLKQMFYPKKETIALQSSSESLKKGIVTLQGSIEVPKERKLGEEAPLLMPDIELNKSSVNVQEEPPKLPDIEICDSSPLLPSDGPNVEEALDDPLPLYDGYSSPLVQLKSCLKRPDDSGNNNSKESTRVTFLLDKEHRSDIYDRKNALTQNESSRDPMPVLSPISSNNSSIAPDLQDISDQMLYLLRKCNEIVGDVRNSLGYVPYHLFSSDV